MTDVSSLSAPARLRAALASPGPLLKAPGVFDALSALLAAQAGFPVVFLSGSGVSFAGLARPDVGLFTATELADLCARIADRIATPVLVDLDSGHGSAASAARAARALARAGAAAVQVEDQAVVKPADALASRPLVSVAEMSARIKAVRDAAPDLVVSARTDAALSEGPAAAVERLRAYVEAGAEMVFAEGLSAPADMQAVTALAQEASVAAVHNVLPGGVAAAASADALEALGYRLALYPGVAIGAYAQAAAVALKALAAGEPPDGPTPKEINALIEGPVLLAQFKAYVAGDGA